MFDSFERGNGIVIGIIVAIAVNIVSSGWDEVGKFVKNVLLGNFVKKIGFIVLW